MVAVGWVGWAAWAAWTCNPALDAGRWRCWPVGRVQMRTRRSRPPCHQPGTHTGERFDRGSPLTQNKRPAQAGFLLNWQRPPEFSTSASVVLHF